MLPFRNVIQISAIGSIGRVFGLLFILAWTSHTILFTDKMKIEKTIGYIYIFLSIYIISILWSVNQSSTIRLSVRFVSVIIFVTAIYIIHDSRSKVLTGMQALILGGYIAVALTLYSYVLYLLEPSGSFRQAAFGFNVNRMGGILVLLLPVAIILTKETHGHLRWLNILYVPFGIIGIIITASRGAFMSLVPIFALLVFYIVSQDTVNISFKKLTLSTSVIFIISSFILNVFTEDRVKYLLSGPEAVIYGDIGGRRRVWEAGLTAFSNSPLLGYGGGNYRYAVEPYLGGQGSAHNSFLSILVDLGVIGLSLYIFIAILIVRVALMTEKRLEWLSLIATWTILSMTNTWQLSAISWLLFIYCIRYATTN